MSEEEDQERQRKRRDDRRALLGDPIEHGGEYRAPKGPSWAPEAGCCLFEAAAGIGTVAALIVAPAWFLLN